MLVQQKGVKSGEREKKRKKKEFLFHDIVSIEPWYVMTSGFVVMFRQSLQFLALLVVWFTYYTLMPRFLYLTMILLFYGRSRLSPQQASHIYLFRRVCFFLALFFITIIPFFLSRKARAMGREKKKKKPGYYCKQPTPE